MWLCCDATRPIWTDEFLHFALGGYKSTSEAGWAINASIMEINHGQTGAYMLLDYWLLKCFGASVIALRIPSILSGFLLLVSAAAIIRHRGFGLVWQCLVIIALAGQQSHLMYYTAEARPYIPLAAASVGVLAFYLAPEPLRGRLSLRLLGWFSILWGCVMHPYFAVYWLALFAFAHLVKLLDGEFKPGFRSLLRHVDLPASIAGFATFVTIAKLSWLRGGPDFKFDPFEWIKPQHLFTVAIDGCHFEFLAYKTLRYLILLFCGLVPLTFLLLPKRLKERCWQVAAPCLLVFLALTISAFLAWMSYRRNYWILGRQWVASAALVPIGFVWLWAALTRTAAAKAPLAGLAAFILVSLVLIQYSWQATAKIDRSASIHNPPSLTHADASATPATPSAWVAAANDNLRSGGPVWEIFGAYYGTPPSRKERAPLTEDYSLEE